MSLRVPCECPTEPYDGLCDLMAITTCHKCKMRMCFEHSKWVEPWGEVCARCYRELNKEKWHNQNERG